MLSLRMHVSDGVVNLLLPLPLDEVPSCAQHCPVRVKRRACSQAL